MRRHVKPKHLHADERGTAFVEMTVAVPVFLAIGLGVLEFANYFFNYQLIQNGVRDAARFVSGISPSTPNLTVKARNIAVYGCPCDPMPSPAPAKRISWWSPTDVSVTYTTVANVTQSTGLPSYRYSGAVPIVTVSTAVNYPSLGFLGFFNIGSITVRASHQERVIGVR